jgi:hypothetical protein
MRSIDMENIRKYFEGLFNINNKNNAKDKMNMVLGITYPTPPNMKRAATEKIAAKRFKPNGVPFSTSATSRYIKSTAYGKAIAALDSILRCEKKAKVNIMADKMLHRYDKFPLITLVSSLTKKYIPNAPIQKYNDWNRI